MTSSISNYIYDKILIIGKVECHNYAMKVFDKNNKLIWMWGAGESPENYLNLINQLIK